MCKNRQIISITSPSHGDATISESKLHVEYRPISNFYGEDAFTYKMTDGLGGTSEATVRLFVTKMNETILQQIAIDSNDKPNSKMSDSLKTRSRVKRESKKITREKCIYIYQIKIFVQFILN